MPRALLITGATGTQGGAVIDALLAKPDDDFLILAVTRDPSSPRAQRTLDKSPTKIRLVTGSHDDVPAMFEAARAAAAGTPVWGIFAIQAAEGVTPEREVEQGKAMVDEALKAGVRLFVYASVERGGEEHSWHDPTPMPQFQAKYHLERYLRDAVASAAPAAGTTASEHGSGEEEGPSGRRATTTAAMDWAILRSVSYMENLLPDFYTKVYCAMLRDHLPADKKFQLIAVADIGAFTADVFCRPERYSGRALGLAADELTMGELASLFERVTGREFDIWGGPSDVVPGYEGALKWFAEVGYRVDIAEFRRQNPWLSTTEDWLKMSPYMKSS